jgi:hypothetical protein
VIGRDSESSSKNNSKSKNPGGLKSESIGKGDRKGLEAVNKEQEQSVEKK